LNDFYFLDDLDNPLALAWKLTGSDTLQVVKISYRRRPAHRAGTEANRTG
jgi:hypothetical protein